MTAAGQGAGRDRRRSTAGFRVSGDCFRVIMAASILTAAILRGQPTQAAHAAVMGGAAAAPVATALGAPGGGRGG